MYNVGDTVIYGSEGVCRISDKTERKFKNRVLSYYILQPVYKENGLVNICIVEKITKFDNDIFLDFRAAGKSFAGSTIRLRMACP